MTQELQRVQHNMTALHSTQTEAWRAETLNTEMEVSQHGGSPIAGWFIMVYEGKSMKIPI